MQSLVIALEPDRPLADQLAEIECAQPDLVLAWLPPGDGLQDALEALANRWPESPVCGSEAVRQFVDGHTCRDGVLLLLELENPASRVTVEVFDEATGAAEFGHRLADGSQHHQSGLILVDGLRFSLTRALDALQSSLDGGSCRTVMAGGRASQGARFEGPGARVFSSRRILPAGALAVWFDGIEASLEVFAEWQPAGPFYTVTAADGSTLYEIDGEPATTWFRRFFEVEGELAPLPFSALRFPLILEGADEDRRGLFRTLRAFDDPPGCVTFWGDFRIGERIRFGIPSDKSLLQAGYRRALASSFRSEVGLLFSCYGREVLLGERAEEEPADLHRALGGAPLAGLSTFGEIGPSRSGSIALYNQTAILLRLRELPR
ncbi:MAG: FIST N-terminal domain-containing protein [Acidobacteriota bacterium]